LFSFFPHLEQGEKLKRQASDAGDKVKAAAQDAKKQAEEQSDGLLDKVFSVFNDVKDSILGIKIFDKKNYS
jgi:hypothetical protein